MDSEMLMAGMRERWKDESNRNFSLKEIAIPYPIIHLYVGETWYYELALGDAQSGLVAIWRRPIEQEATPEEKKRNLLEFMANPRRAFVAGSHFSHSESLLLRTIKVGFPLEIQYFDEKASLTEPIRGSTFFSNQELHHKLFRMAGEDERVARWDNRVELNHSFTLLDWNIVRRLTTGLSPKGEKFMIQLFKNARAIGFRKFLELAWRIWNLRFRGAIGRDPAFDGNPAISYSSRLLYDDICEKLKIPFPEIPHS